MKKNRRKVLSVMSIVSLILANWTTAQAQNNTDPGANTGPGLATGQTIQLAQVAPQQAAATEQPFAPGWVAAQTILLAQTTAPNQTNAPAPAVTMSPESSDRFKQNEWDLSVYALYSDQAGHKWGIGSAATYFFTPQIGAGGSTYWTEAGGTLFDNLAAEGYYRFPLQNVVAPYAVISVGRQFDRQYWFESFGGGVDYRAFENISAFSDLQFRVADTSRSQNGIVLRVGARFLF